MSQIFSKYFMNILNELQQWFSAFWITRSPFILDSYWCTSVTSVVVVIIINLNKQTHVSLMLYIFIWIIFFNILIQIIRLLKNKTILKIGNIYILFITGLHWNLSLSNYVTIIAVYSNRSIIRATKISVGRSTKSISFFSLSSDILDTVC